MEKSDIGKVIRFYNSNDYGGATYTINHCSFAGDEDEGFTWGTGSYVCYIKPQEVVEFTCFETPHTSGFAGEWMITNRFGHDNFKNSGAIGRFPRIIAMGTLTGSSSGASLSGYWYNGKSLSTMMSVTRSGEGYYTLTMKSGSLPSGYFVFATGTGDNEMKPTIGTRGTTSFIIYISDDASRNDGSCVFMIMDPNWWYNLT